MTSMPENDKIPHCRDGSAVRPRSRLSGRFNRFSTGIISLLLWTAAAVDSGVRDPFAPGFSMGTLGAVIDDQGASGREPWTGADRCKDSSGFGFAMSGISYYGSVGSISGPDGINQAFGGGWYAGKKMVCKASIAYLNALDVYYEQSVFFSAGTALLPFIRLSVEAAGYRIGAALPGSPTRTIGEAGISAWAPWSWAAFSLRIGHLILAPSEMEGADPLPAIRFGIHTTRNGFGGQGALVTIAPGEPRPVCFTIGEEYRLTRAITIQAALSNNPVLLGFGMTFAIGREANLGFALVNHSILGWSQGCSAEFHRIRGGDPAGE